MQRIEERKIEGVGRVGEEVENGRMRILSGLV